MLEREIAQGGSERREKVGITPYVVSEDIQLLLQDWAEKQGFVLPKPEFFNELRVEFKGFMSQIFDGFELVPEAELLNGITQQVKATGLFPISFDRVYFKTEPTLDITRLVDKEGQGKGLGKRGESPTLLKQFRGLKDMGIKEVVLVDDVIFTGDMIRRTGNLLRRMEIKVPVVCVGIAISEGIEQLNGFGQEVRCVREYREVIDEICERDFYPGVPMCGRSLIGNENIGVPYVLPFGNPGKWASIPPEWQDEMSRFCLGQTIKLFKAIEESSNRMVRCEDLERKVFLLPNGDTRFVDALKTI